MSFEIVAPVELDVSRRPEIARVRTAGLPVPLRLGLIENSKKNALELLLGAGDALRDNGMVSSTTVVNKPLASMPVDDDVLSDLLAGSDLVLTGVGD